MEKNKKNNLFEADYVERALDYITKYVKSKGKSPDDINAIRAKVEKRLKQLNPNVSKSSALKTFKSTMDDKKNNSITESDIEKLLEYMVEADKAKKQDTEPKQEPKAKQEPKPQPKQKDAPKEEPVTPSDAVSKLMKSSGGANFMQDMRRMGSKQDKIDAYLKLITSLPGIQSSEVRRAIVNKLKVSEK